MDTKNWSRQYKVNLPPLDAYNNVLAVQDYPDFSLILENKSISRIAVAFEAQPIEIYIHAMSSTESMMTATLLSDYGFPCQDQQLVAHVMQNFEAAFRAAALGRAEPLVMTDFDVDAYLGLGANKSTANSSSGGVWWFIAIMVLVIIILARGCN